MNLGHESAIVDIKFNSIDSNIICSIDNGDNIAQPHVIGMIITLED